MIQKLIQKGICIGFDSWAQFHHSGDVRDRRNAPDHVGTLYESHSNFLIILWNFL